MTVQNGLTELVGRSDSDGAGDSATRQSVTGCTRSDDVQKEPETGSSQSQFLRSRVLSRECLRRRTSGSRRTLRITFTATFQFVST